VDGFEPVLAEVLQWSFVDVLLPFSVEVIEPVLVEVRVPGLSAVMCKVF
jgi:hypothetical protein